MKSLLLILISILGVHCANIPVPYLSGTAYVDIEELLDTALVQPLYQHGITKVDVDNLRNDDTAYEVDIYSAGPIDPSFKDILAKTLKSDLGFTDVTVKSDNFVNNFQGRFFGNKSRFYVYFNPATMTAEMQSLASDLMKTTYLELEDSPWD